MKDIDVRIHWLSITVYTDIDNIKEFWSEKINEHLGMLDDVGHGSAGFRHMNTQGIYLILLLPLC